MGEVGKQAHFYAATETMLDGRLRDTALIENRLIDRPAAQTVKAQFYVAELGAGNPVGEGGAEA